MESKKRIILFVLILVTGSSFNVLFSQKILTKPTRQSSLEAFSNGSYEQAYSEFSELLKIYTKDPLYNYYSGVCLVKLNRGPEEAVIFLNQAMQGAAVVKTLPSDAQFYLGRALQMSGRYPEAIESYNLYTKQAGKKSAKELNVPELIKQCNDKKGEIAKPEVIAVEDVGAAATTATVENSKVEIESKESVTAAGVIAIQPVQKDIAPETDLPVSYEKKLDQALEAQFFADSLNTLVAQQKVELGKLTGTEKSTMAAKIAETELLAVSYQKTADQKYSEANAAINPAKEDAVNIVPVQQPDYKTTNDSVQHSDPIPAIDTLNNSGKEPVKDFAVKPDSVNKSVLVVPKPVVSKPVEIFAVFEMLSKPESDPGKKVIIDPEVPDGLVYRIQLAVFRNPVALSYFKGISPIYGFKIAGTDKTNYYGGMFRRISDAKKALTTVKAKGFKDAFLVAFSGNKTVSSDRAVQMEKEWGNKPIITADKSGQVSPSDTIPPTLSFRVEVLRSAKPVKEDVTDGIKKVAGNRGMDVQTLEDGNTAYYVGKFITFESAAEYNDLMTRNGYRDAKVVAFLGEKEVPVETARQLVDNLK